MRPRPCGPGYAAVPGAEDHEGFVPSMRPRPCGPGYLAGLHNPSVRWWGPSMRPRPCGPGYGLCLSAGRSQNYPFNEAQAMRPGIHVPRVVELVRMYPFNEAQAMRPGIPQTAGATPRLHGQPSMRPRPCGPGYAVNIGSGLPGNMPSMRPRPCGPGYPMTYLSTYCPPGSPFNEAQAMRPGILGIPCPADTSDPAPSMRPRPCGPGYW